jgi:hypothetical protein
MLTMRFRKEGLKKESGILL